MLVGDLIQLRLVREQDLGALHELLTDLDARGPYFPLGVTSEPALRAAFAKNGFWDKDEGMLLMVAGDEIVGEIEYFPITHYLQGYEISYQLFGSRHAGQGYTTEAVNLLTRYLFGRKRVNRMQLNIHPDNAASKRVAVKCGFTFEGVMRGCWFHNGEFQDLEIWSLLRDEASNGSVKPQLSETPPAGKRAGGTRLLSEARSRPPPGDPARPAGRPPFRNR